jgi:DNA repair protein RadC
MAVRIQSLPPEARPRERLLQNGPGILSDAELVALVLGSGRRGASAIEVAGELLAELGSLSQAARARPDELARIPVGQTKAAGLAAALELSRRAEARHPAPPRLSGPADIALAVGPHLTDPRHEEVFVVAMTAGNRLRRVERVGIGGESACTVEVGEILAAACRLGASALALARSHPSGDPTPSSEDIAMTRALRIAAEQVGLRLVDHVIVAGARWASLLELGYIQNTETT